MPMAFRNLAINTIIMLTEIYIEALLVDSELADQVWETWNAGETDNEAACIAWTLNALCSSYDQHGDNRDA